jgi:hypothetical protein
MFANVISIYCAVLGQLVGPNSQVLSLVLVGITAVMLILWMVNENKEGMVIWIIKIAFVMGLLLNIFNLISVFGFAPISCR